MCVQKRVSAGARFVLLYIASGFYLAKLFLYKDFGKKSCVVKLKYRSDYPLGTTQKTRRRINPCALFCYMMEGLKYGHHPLGQLLPLGIYVVVLPDRHRTVPGHPGRGIRGAAVVGRSRDETAAGGIYGGYFFRR